MRRARTALDQTQRTHNNTQTEVHTDHASLGRGPRPRTAKKQALQATATRKANRLHSAALKPSLLQSGKTASGTSIPSRTLIPKTRSGRAYGSSGPRKTRGMRATNVPRHLNQLMKTTSCPTRHAHNRNASELEDEQDPSADAVSIGGSSDDDDVDTACQVPKHLAPEANKQLICELAASKQRISELEAAIAQSNAKAAALQSQVYQLEDLVLCPVCIDNRKNLAFKCGHTTCTKCGEGVKECPICRTRITKRIRLF